MDLTTTYMGMTLKSPLVPSASPLSENIDNIKHMEDAGAAAVVMHSLFEEQLTRDRDEMHHHLTHGTESFAEALTYFPDPGCGKNADGRSKYYDALFCTAATWHSASAGN